MAETYSTQLEGVLNASTAPAVKAEGNVYEGRARSYRATVTLAAQGNGDTIVIARPPAGAVFTHGIVTTDTSLGTSTIAIGSTDLPAGYRAGATLTTTNVPQVFGVVTGITEGPYDGQTDVKITIGVAALPASGTLVVDLFYAGK